MKNVRRPGRRSRYIAPRVVRLATRHAAWLPAWARLRGGVRGDFPQRGGWWCGGAGVREGMSRGRYPAASPTRDDHAPRGNPSTCIAMIPRMISDVPDAMLAAGAPRKPFCNHCSGRACAAPLPGRGVS